MAGVAWVLAIGYAIGLATRDLSIGSEMLSRTAPSILDLLIALVGGLAGGYTFVATTLTGAIVGVAIATALVPRLTTCGILMAHHLPTLAGGAFLLFLANFAAIAVGAMTVFLLAGHRPAASDNALKVVVPRLISVTLLVVLATHLTMTFRRTVAQLVLETDIRRTLAQEVVKIPGARLVTLTLGSQPGATIAWAVIRTPHPIAPDEVARLNDLVNRAAGRSVGLHVRSVITAETTRDGDVYESSILPGEEPTGR
jgi:uncharacterized membrane protein